MRYSWPAGFGLLHYPDMHAGRRPRGDEGRPAGTQRYVPHPSPDIATGDSAKHARAAPIPLAAMPKNWNGHRIVFCAWRPAYRFPDCGDQPAGSRQIFDRCPPGICLGRVDLPARRLRRAHGGGGFRPCAQFFVERIAQPRRTILHGASYGGLVGAKLLKSMPRRGRQVNYDGAFFNSGFVAGARWATTSAPICARSTNTIARIFPVRTSRSIRSGTEYRPGPR